MELGTGELGAVIISRRSVWSLSSLDILRRLRLGVRPSAQGTWNVALGRQVLGPRVSGLGTKNYEL